MFVATFRTTEALNPVRLTRPYTQPAVKPEKDVQETGLKSEYFDHRFRANLAGLLLSSTRTYRYRTGQADFVLNAALPKSMAWTRIYGNSIRNLTNASSAFIHGRYTSFPNAPYCFPPVTASSCLPGIGAVGTCTTMPQD